LARRADEQAEQWNKTARAVISGSRLFNTVFGLSRNAENIRRSLGTFQSGSPPGHTTTIVAGKKSLTFQQSAMLLEVSGAFS
jgi:hypothetical protein